MTLAANGAISLGAVNTEVGAAAGAERSLSWVKANSAFADADLNSIHGQTYFAAVSSQGSITRASRTSTVTNCAKNCYSQSHPGWPYWTYAYPQNCSLIANENCNQCGVAHGGNLLQGQCNCNCNCWVCNCVYVNCNCATCDCGCFPAGTKALLFDGTLRNVEDLKEGDLLMGHDGKPAKILECKFPKLNRKLLTINHEIYFAEDHAFITRVDGKQGLWSSNPDLWRRSIMRGLVDNDAILTSPLGKEIEYAHIGGWKKAAYEIVKPEGDGMQLYAFVVEHGKLTFFNGYMVTNQTDEKEFVEVYGHGYDKAYWPEGGFNGLPH